MNLIYLTLKNPLPSHLTYAIVDLDSQTTYFDNQLTTPPDFTECARSDVNTYWWKLGCETFNEFINHPDVIQFTRESHPELFI